MKTVLMLLLSLKAFCNPKPRCSKGDHQNNEIWQWSVYRNGF